VLSAATEQLVVDWPPTDAWLTDLGTHQLRDLPRPERVVQLCHPDLRNEFPPLRTPKDVGTHNLPVQLTSFVGRQAQMDDARTLLADNRLVTLTGAGTVDCRDIPAYHFPPFKADGTENNWDAAKERPFDLTKNAASVRVADYETVCAAKTHAITTRPTD
jgi:hypothetical protein